MKAALQMYSVREYMHSFPLEAFQKSAEVFHYLQLPPPLVNDRGDMYFGKSAAEWASVIRESGSEVIGGYLRTEVETWEDTLEFYRQIGCRYVVIHIGYFPTMEQFGKNCALYNAFGKKCRELGMKLLYENHYHEWQYLEGRPVIDRLLEETDPELLSLQLNQYWMMRGLVDPRAVLGQYHDRVETLVQEDYPLEEVDKFNMWKFYRYHPIAYNIQFGNILQGNEIENILPVQCELFTELGDGMLPLQSFIDQASVYPNIRYVLLKQDYTRYESEFLSIQRSADNYRHIRNVEWK